MERQQLTTPGQTAVSRLSLIHQAALRTSLGPVVPRTSHLSPFEVSQMSGVSISMVERPKIHGPDFVTELIWLRKEVSTRCFLDAELWVNEILAYCPDKLCQSQTLHSDDNEMDTTSSSSSSFQNTDDSMNKFKRTQSSKLAYTLVRNRDFRRAAFFFEKTKKINELDHFLYYRCLFLAFYQEHMESDAEGIERKTSYGEEKSNFVTLYETMDEEGLREHPDVFFEYLMGLIEVELGQKEKACSTFQSVISRDPRIWPAWEGFSRLVTDIEAADAFVQQLKVKSIWMSDWFMILVLERFHQDTMAIQRAESLVSRGLTGIPMIIGKIAACSNHRHDHDQAIANFEDIRAVDPYRLTDLNLLSDSLYIRGDQKKLSQLALEIYKVHKFRWETCCIVGNYHAIRRDNEHSIKFFQRALRLNPGMASLWVLIGHEFMEMKNNAAACVSYRRAIEIDRFDYRGWYGLGQMYDIMKMPSYSLFYYQQAQKCKPHDSRLLVALGDIYTKLNRYDDAEKCFSGAYLFGDVEGSALWNLAKLHETCNDEDKAAQTFEVFLVVHDSLTNMEEKVMFAVAYLANYYFKIQKYEKAQEFATKCLEHEAICQEGNRLFNEISKIMKAKEKAEGEKEQREKQVPDANAGEAEEDMMLSDGDDNEVTF